MNEIKNALKENVSYDEKLALFRKYSNNTSMAASFDRMRSLRYVRKTLDKELRKLGRRGKIEPVSTRQPTRSIRTSKTRQITEPTLNPLVDQQVLENMIQERSRLANARDQAGRTLIADALDLTEAKRADLVAEQKALHGQIMQLTIDIDLYKKSGAIPVAAPPPPQFTAAELEQMDRDWKELQRKRSRARKNLERWKRDKNQLKITYYTQQLSETQSALEDLAPKLGKSFRS